MDLKKSATRAATTSLIATATLALAAIPAAAEDYLVKPGDTVSGIAATHGTSVTAIVIANDLDERATIYAGQHLTLPAIAPTVAPAPAATQTYVVAPGDTLWDLAARFGTSVGALQSANGIGNAALIRIGQTLTVPGSANAAPAPATAPATATLTHTVAKGDNLWRISATYGVPLATIVSANSLTNPSLIREGATLVIPGATTTPASAPATASTVARTTTASFVYTVRPGDTLSAIASRTGATVSGIAQANGLADPSLIRVGQRLTIPGGTPTGLVGDTFLGRTYPADVVAAANVNKATLNATTVPSRAEMQALVVSTAQHMGVDPALAQAIAYQESGFDQRAVSPANAIGTMQVIPSSGEWASDLVGRDLNLLDPTDNVTAGVAILKRLTDRNELSIAIAGYYQGERSVRERGMNTDTKRYVDSVLALMKRFD